MSSHLNEEAKVAEPAAVAASVATPAEGASLSAPASSRSSSSDASAAATPSSPSAGESTQICNRCLKLGGKACAKCKCTFYCSRACQVADWPTHKRRCNKDQRKLVIAPPNAASIVASKVPPELLARAFSFLSFFQASEAACTNHAWRNASLLPSAASHARLYVSGLADPTWLRMSAHAKRHLLSLEWGNKGQPAPTPAEAAAVTSDAPPVFPHLQQLIWLGASEEEEEMSEQQAGAQREWLRSMSPTLRALSFDERSLSGRVARFSEAYLSMPQLRHLALYGPHVSNSFVEVLPQLTKLEALSLPSVVMDEESESVALSRLHVSRLVSACAASSTLRRLEFTSFDAKSFDGGPPVHLSLAQLFASSAPVFSRLTQLILHHQTSSQPSGNDELQHFTRLADHFPVLEELELRFQHRKDPSSQDEGEAHLKESAWREAMLEALGPGLAPLLQRSLRRLRVMHTGFTVTNAQAIRDPFSRSDIDCLLPIVAPYLHSLVLQPLRSHKETPLTPEALELLIERAPNLHLVGMQVDSCETERVHQLTSRLPHLKQLTVLQHLPTKSVESMEKLHAKCAKLPRLATARQHLPVCQLIARMEHVNHPAFRSLPPSIGQLCVSYSFVALSTLFEYAQYYPLAIRHNADHPWTLKGFRAKSNHDYVEVLSVEPNFFEGTGNHRVSCGRTIAEEDYKQAVKGAAAAKSAAAKEGLEAPSLATVQRGHHSTADSRYTVIMPCGRTQQGDAIAVQSVYVGKFQPFVLPRGIPHSLYLLQAALTTHRAELKLQMPGAEVVGVFKDCIYILPYGPDYARLKARLLARFREAEHTARARMHDDPIKTEIRGERAHASFLKVSV